MSYTTKEGTDYANKNPLKTFNFVEIPDNATNGDVIKAIFPEFHIDEMSHSVWIGYDNMSFRSDWWNAPYKAESEEV